MKTPPVFFRESRTLKLTFSTKPNAEARRALCAAGYRWNGSQWWTNCNSTIVIKPAQLAELLTPVPQPEPATA